eukprot:TRINITY_DN22376_c0_g1_i2.p1 TRINITY_DN22376_c0_g1~~TRINITY_DN22376_c0_g1_i2.p1  ORF type:complete len:333 (-),score=50.42 TRINITY_DN22376_c0_g1_i2:63-1061(-)
MSRLELVEETRDQLVLRMGVLPMLGQFGFCIFSVAVSSFSVTIFLKKYLGPIIYVLVGVPGLACIVCGCIGCLNARKFTFVFDRLGGQFTAIAGSATLSRPLSQVVVVHVERELSSSAPASGASVVGGPNTFAAALLFADGQRCRLEGGASVSSTGPLPPPHLQAEADRIRGFLGLPQPRVALLDVTRHTAERKMDERQAHVWLNNYMACRALEPQLEAPIIDYDWVDPPENVEVPRASRRSAGSAGGIAASRRSVVAALAARVVVTQDAIEADVVQGIPRGQAQYVGTGFGGGAHLVSAASPHAGAIVVGRPVVQQAQPPRVVQVVVQGQP